jgi:dihydrofolate reductase
LIDEYRLFIFPLMLGSGKRLFGGGTMPIALKPIQSVTSDKGATCIRLARGGKLAYGRIDRPDGADEEGAAR